MLGGPRAIRVRGHAQDMDMAGADLDREEHVETPYGDRAVDVEEVARQHGRGLRAQELAPCGAAALRRGRDPQLHQDSPHCGGSDSVAEA